MAKKMKVVDSTKKNLTNEEKIERRQAEERASVGLKELQRTPPRHLTGAAKNEYKRVVVELGKLPIRDLDRAVLENYCTWYGVYKEISEKLNKNGYTMHDEEKGLVAHPLIATLEKASTQIRATASQLGLTVDSRMKMFMPKQEEKKASIFDKFGG